MRTFSRSDPTVTKIQSVKLKLKTLKKQKYKFRKKNKMKTIEPVEHIEELKQESSSSSEDNLIVKGIFKCILSFITAFFNLMTVIFKGSPGFIWGIIFLFTFQTALSQAAPTSTNDVSMQTSLSNMPSSQGPSSSFILYTVNAMESQSFTFQMNEIKQDEFAGLSSSCSAIPRYMKSALNIQPAVNLHK